MHSCIPALWSLASNPNAPAVLLKAAPRLLLSLFLHYLPWVRFGIPALRSPASNRSAVLLKEAQNLIFSPFLQYLHACFYSTSRFPIHGLTRTCDSPFLMSFLFWHMPSRLLAWFPSRRFMLDVNLPARP